ncbi:MAG TPA: hypothetical protein VGL66_14495 [Caulobacteraceae bacterium]|jgi:hypothetical protein
MGQLKSTEIASALTEAMAAGRFVRLTTRYDERVSGYVAAIGPGFVMIAVVNHRIWFDGFECFRRPDILAVGDDPYAAFHETALSRRGDTRPQTPPVSLENIEALLTTAGKLFPLVTIHTEVEDADVLFIGRVLEVTAGELVMLEVDPGAEWDAEPERCPTADITRVAFGSDYEDALWLVAGDPPSA